MFREPDVGLDACSRFHFLPHDATQSAVGLSMSLCRPSVRPSVCNVQVCFSHRLEYSLTPKIISQLISLS